MQHRYDDMQISSLVEQPKTVKVISKEFAEFAAIAAKGVAAPQ